MSWFNMPVNVHQDLSGKVTSKKKIWVVNWISIVRTLRAVEFLDSNLSYFDFFLLLSILFKVSYIKFWTFGSLMFSMILGLRGKWYVLDLKNCKRPWQRNRRIFHTRKKKKKKIVELGLFVSSPSFGITSIPKKRKRKVWLLSAWNN